jgi:hypothetical protein
VKFKQMAIALVHHPVLDRRGDLVTSAVTNLDIHDIARLVTTYNLSRYYLVTPAAEQQQLVARITGHWQQGAGATYNPDRKQALDCVSVQDTFDDALADWCSLAGQESQVILTGARHQDGVTFHQAREIAGEVPVLLVFGTGHGLAPEIYTEGRRSLEPVRAGRYNHLSVRTAAAIILDRLVGEDGEIDSLP